MSAQKTLAGAREAVGIFHDAETFQAAVDDLLSAGFHRAELSFLASEHAVEEKLGHRYRRAAALADDPAVPRVAYVSCNPSTFARDAKALLDGGYRLDWVKPVGQFRWSTHVELAACFSR